MRNLRAYVFIHKHISGIQKAVQAAHCTATLAAIDSSVSKQWATRDYTLILLDAGNTASLTSIYSKLALGFEGSAFPVVQFQEDEATLGALVTACGVILPKALVDSYKNIQSPLHSITDKMAYGAQLGNSSYGLDLSKTTQIEEALSIITKTKLLENV